MMSRYFFISQTKDFFLSKTHSSSSWTLIVLIEAEFSSGVEFFVYKTYTQKLQN